MRYLVVTVVLVIAASSFASSQTNTKTNAKNQAERDLMKLEEEWHSAYVKHAPLILERILADEYSSINSRGGISNKALDIAGLKADTAEYDYSTPYDLNVRVYGDAAVVTGRTKEKGRDSGVEFTTEYRWTDVFVKRLGRWQCVAAQVVRLPQTSVNNAEDGKVRRKLEALYASQDEAIKKNDFKIFVETFAPDYSIRLLNGQSFTREQVEGFIRDDMARTLSVEKSTSTIEELRVNGNEAVVTVTHEASRTLSDAQGKPHKVENKVIHRETWVRTGEGWKIRLLEESKQIYLLRDGRPLN